MSKICIHGFVTGKVQGVWFRSSTQTFAANLNLTGWAKNLADGRVEVHACGEPKDIEVLQNWLWHGPPLAKVTDVTVDIVEWSDEYTDFSVR